MIIVTLHRTGWITETMLDAFYEAGHDYVTITQKSDITEIAVDTQPTEPGWLLKLLEDAERLWSGCRWVNIRRDV